MAYIEFNFTDMKRTDTASKVINASPHTIYRAFLDPVAVAAWRPPEGMVCRIYSFDPREGGKYRMAFEYKNQDHSVQGKTSAHADVFEGTFVELREDARIVEVVKFESDDPAFKDELTFITTFERVTDGTLVTIVAENVPDAIRPEDHAQGMGSTLMNLAAFTEEDGFEVLGKNDPAEG